MTTTADDTDYEPPTENTLQVIRGLPLTIWYEREIVEEIFDFIPEDGDVIIATYPKTGTTWMQYIVHQILTRGESFPPLNDLWEKVIPFLEMSGVSAIKSMTTKPRVYKHHFPYNLMQKNTKAKIIYVYRKPEDVIVSFYHFLINLNVYVDFDEYVDNFLIGKVSYGQYFDHIISYLEHKEDGNILLVSYEKLKIQTKVEILRVAKFLGEEYYDLLTDDESILDKILEQTSFDYMKKNLSLTLPKNPRKAFESNESTNDMSTREITFFRNGVIGDGKHLLNECQLQRLREQYKEKMQDTDILLEWLQD